MYAGLSQNPSKSRRHLRLKRRGRQAHDDHCHRQTLSEYDDTRCHLRPHRIASPSFTAQPILINSPTSTPIEHSPTANDGNRCYLPQCSPSPVCAEPATAMHQEWPFQGFLERIRIGNVTTCNFDTFSSPSIKIHSEVPPAKLRAKRKCVPWELKEHETILRMKKDDSFWEEIYNSLLY
ncbi:f778cc23-8b8b-473b-8c56-4ba5b659b5fe-CDS [Sclerotinia trifoliorum]|uniref:F778cc23-8b8b-473b-8c56-4ba5b659b5fe-CDS n=1 Tax=Sclerotinia trifoliorum TaxID=28548 RepID=A0A8H2ZV67_9HELO|nr:f778cc23-8b8b-473b-8c56-4ba5b659b5fe-CDS [Sclerotinia trifoliorum]